MGTLSEEEIQTYMSSSFTTLERVTVCTITIYIDEVGKISKGCTIILFLITNIESTKKKEERYVCIY